MSAELLFEEFSGQSPQPPDRLDSQPLEGTTGRFSNTPEPADRERVEELLFRARLHNDEPVGLLQVAGDLGEKFIRGDDMRAFIVSSRAGSLAGEAAHQQSPEMNIEALYVEAGGTIDFIVDIGDVLNSDQYL